MCYRYSPKRFKFERALQFICFQAEKLFIILKLRKLIGNTASLLAAIFILPITFLLLLLFGVHRRIVDLILRGRHGAKFGGLLSGTDSFWAIKDDSSTNLITILMTIKCNYKVDVYKRVRRKIYQKFFRNALAYPKMLSSLNYFCGYHYLIRNSVSIEECVGKIDDCDLLEQIGQYSSLPRSHRGLWEVLVGSRPSKKDNALYYTIVFRVHHSLGDGVALIKLLINALEEAELQNEEYDPIDSSFIEDLFPRVGIVHLIPVLFNLTTRVCSNLLVLLKTLGVLIKAPGALISEILTRTPDVSILHGPKLSGENVVAIRIESEQHYVNAIKRIKSRIGDGVRFSDVLLTAVSASVAEYYEKVSAWDTL